MTSGSSDIDAIVLEVIQRLKALSKTENTAPSTQDASVGVLEDRVISLATVAEKLAGEQRVLLRPDAIVTPAASDELRRLGISVVVEPRVVAEADKAAPFVAAVGNYEVPRQIVDNMQPVCHVDEFDSDEDAVNGSVAAIGRGRAAALWTARPARAVCLANRHADVWAVYGSDLAAVNAAFETAPINLLVMDHRRHGPFLQRSIFRAFLNRFGASGSAI